MTVGHSHRGTQSQISDVIASRGTQSQKFDVIASIGTQSQTSDISEWSFPEGSGIVT